MHLALYQPDIPQNTGTILRLCACLDVAAHIIEPAGSPVSDRHFRRAGMDYLDQVSITRHDSWSKFEQWRNPLKSNILILVQHFCSKLKRLMKNYFQMVSTQILKGMKY